MAGALVDSSTGWPFLRSLSIIMTNAEGLFERSKCWDIFFKSMCGSSRHSSTSASLQAEGASSLYLLATFSTSGFGVFVPLKTPSAIHRILTIRRSAGFFAPFRISYIDAMSSSKVLFRFFSCSSSIRACRSVRLKWCASSMTSGSRLEDLAFCWSYSIACCCVTFTAKSGLYIIIILCQSCMLTPGGGSGGGSIPGPSGGNGGSTPGGGGISPVGGAGTSGGGGYFSSSSVIFSLISPANIFLKSAASRSPFFSASSAAAVIFS
mmetsp:Transcript_45540/g.136103  ORF Transcript_45540/g.136103 Transcript_45540/m.136103 type:complete len:265 (+) Transcript_45540:95-889(+)